MFRKCCHHHLSDSKPSAAGQGFSRRFQHLAQQKSFEVRRGWANAGTGDANNLQLPVTLILDDLQIGVDRSGGLEILQNRNDAASRGFPYQFFRAGALLPYLRARSN